MEQFLEILLKIIWVISILILLYWLYHAVFSIFGIFCKKRAADPGDPIHHFLVVIAARNEEAVIGHLVESLVRQNYPRDLFEILVVPNNCTDRTAEAARLAGAHILECTVPVRTKGDALNFAFQNLPQDLIADAYLVFDADNLVHPDFMLHMNQAIEQGAVAAQGYRDTKNPHDSLTSGCWAMTYWFSSRLYDKPRNALRLTSLVTGTGFMMTDTLRLKMGGWHTKTVADDFEWTMQCVLAGETVAYVQDAVTYDEQSLTWRVTWIQRKRWMIGVLHALRLYLKPLFRRVIKDRKFLYVDFFLFALNPIIQYLSLIVFPLGLILRVLVLHYPLFPLTPLYDQFSQSLILSIVAPILIAVILAVTEKKMRLPLLPSILVFPVFVAMQLPASLVALFSRRDQDRWDKIEHTRAMKIDDLK